SGNVTAHANTASLHPGVKSRVKLFFLSHKAVEIRLPRLHRASEDTLNLSEAAFAGRIFDLARTSSGFYLRPDLLGDRRTARPLCLFPDVVPRESETVTNRNG